MRTLYDVPAPAKLNLFLHITGRRSDGYHLLQSVFMLIDWQDQLHFERTASPTISRSDLASPLPSPAATWPAPPHCPPTDLCVRAARASQAATGCTQGAHIGLGIHSRAGRHGWRLQRCHHLGGPEPPVAPACPAPTWPGLVNAWGPMCPFSSRTAMPGWKALARAITPLTGAATLPASAVHRGQTAGRIWTQQTSSLSPLLTRHKAWINSGLGRSLRFWP